MKALSCYVNDGVFYILIIFIVLPTSYSAPVVEDGSQALQTLDGGSGCYYNFEHYYEGDRILTNEPCLNCTCHNRMLMCYLRVCPFTKAIGQDCTVEKKPDQCCPVITCPQVPVKLLTSSTTQQPPSTTALGRPDSYGCMLNGNTFYADGAQVPSDPKKPCELCYCIRNHTACVMQECTLNVEGCKPVYQEGVCCPVRYDCDYEETVTTQRTTTLGLVTTPGGPTDCLHDGNVYHDGEMVTIDNKQPCEHCYCMRGDIVCAVQECGSPLEGSDCTPLETPPGQCCPTSYHCANGTVPIKHTGEENQNKEHSEPTPDEASIEEVSEEVKPKPESEESSQSESDEDSKSQEVPPVPENHPKEDLERYTSEHSGVKPTSEISPSEVGEEQEITEEDAVTHDSKLEVDVQTTEKVTLGTNPSADNEHENSVNKEEKETYHQVNQTSNEEQTVKSDTDTEESTSFNSQNLPIENVTPNSQPSNVETNSHPSVLGSNEDNASDKVPFDDRNNPLVSNEIPEITTIESRPSPDVVSQEEIVRVPGEGSCLVDNKTYAPDSDVPPAPNSCHKSCKCINSIVECERIDCSLPPSNYANCMPVQTSDSCCPTYMCDQTPSDAPEVQNQLSIDKIDTSVNEEGTTEGENQSPSSESQPSSSENEAVANSHNNEEQTAPAVVLGIPPENLVPGADEIPLSLVPSENSPVSTDHGDEASSTSQSINNAGEVNQEDNINGNVDHESAIHSHITDEAAIHEEHAETTDNKIEHPIENNLIEGQNNQVSQPFEKPEQSSNQGSETNSHDNPTTQHNLVATELNGEDFKETTEPNRQEQNNENYDSTNTSEDNHSEVTEHKEPQDNLEDNKTYEENYTEEGTENNNKGVGETEIPQINDVSSSPSKDINDHSFTTQHPDLTKESTTAGEVTPNPDGTQLETLSEVPFSNEGHEHSSTSATTNEDQEEQTDSSVNNQNELHQSHDELSTVTEVPGEQSESGPQNSSEDNSPNTTSEDETSTLKVPQSESSFNVNSELPTNNELNHFSESDTHVNEFVSESQSTHTTEANNEIHDGSTSEGSSPAEESTSGITETSPEQEQHHGLNIVTEGNPEQEQHHDLNIVTEGNPEQEQHHDLNIATEVNPEQEQHHDLNIVTEGNPEQEQHHDLNIVTEGNPDQEQHHDLNIVTEGNPDQEQHHDLNIVTEENPEQEQHHDLSIVTEENPEQEQHHDLNIVTEEIPEQEQHHDLSIVTEGNPEQEQHHDLNMVTEGDLLVSQEDSTDKNSHIDGAGSQPNLQGTFQAPVIGDNDTGPEETHKESTIDLPNGALEEKLGTSSAPESSGVTEHFASNNFNTENDLVNLPEAPYTESTMFIKDHFSHVPVPSLPVTDDGQHLEGNSELKPTNRPVVVEPSNSDHISEPNEANIHEESIGEATSESAQKLVPNSQESQEDHLNRPNNGEEGQVENEEGLNKNLPSTEISQTEVTHIELHEDKPSSSITSEDHKIEDVANKFDSDQSTDGKLSSEGTENENRYTTEVSKQPEELPSSEANNESQLGNEIPESSDNPINIPGMSIEGHLESSTKNPIPDNELVISSDSPTLVSDPQVIQEGSATESGEQTYTVPARENESDPGSDHFDIFGQSTPIQQHLPSTPGPSGIQFGETDFKETSTDKKTELEENNLNGLNIGEQGAHTEESASEETSTESKHISQGDLEEIGNKVQIKPEESEEVLQENNVSHSQTLPDVTLDSETASETTESSASSDVTSQGEGSASELPLTENETGIENIHAENADKNDSSLSPNNKNEQSTISNVALEESNELHITETINPSDASTKTSVRPESTFSAEVTSNEVTTPSGVSQETDHVHGEDKKPPTQEQEDNNVSPLSENFEGDDTKTEAPNNEDITDAEMLHVTTGSSTKTHDEIPTEEGLSLAQESHVESDGESIKPSIIQSSETSSPEGEADVGHDKNGEPVKEEHDLSPSTEVSQENQNTGDESIKEEHVISPAEESNLGNQNNAGEPINEEHVISPNEESNLGNQNNAGEPIEEEHVISPAEESNLGNQENIGEPIKEEHNIFPDEESIHANQDNAGEPIKEHEISPEEDTNHGNQDNAGEPIKEDHVISPDEQPNLGNQDNIDEPIKEEHNISPGEESNHANQDNAVEPIKEEHDIPSKEESKHGNNQDNTGEPIKEGQSSEIYTVIPVISDTIEQHESSSTKPPASDNQILETTDLPEKQEGSETEHYLEENSSTTIRPSAHEESSKPDYNELTTPGNTFSGPQSEINSNSEDQKNEATQTSFPSETVLEGSGLEELPSIAQTLPINNEEQSLPESSDATIYETSSSTSSLLNEVHDKPPEPDTSDVSSVNSELYQSEHSETTTSSTEESGLTSLPSIKPVNAENEGNQETTVNEGIPDTAINHTVTTGIPSVTPVGAEFVDVSSTSTTEKETLQESHTTLSSLQNQNTLPSEHIFPDSETHHSESTTGIHSNEPLFPNWTQKPYEHHTTSEAPHLSEDSHYPSGFEQEYEDDDGASYGPGTCRYGGKVYLSAQQIPRDDPCDFCFCFRSDIICLQQSCPPPIKGCYQETIKGFCCPRYECHVSMATMLNITTTTTTTTTTLPPHFFAHAYKGAATKAGCQVKGVAYNVGDRIPSTSGPCLECRCGANGQMKCEPTVCGPQEALLRQVMDAAAVSRR